MVLDGGAHGVLHDLEDHVMQMRLDVHERRGRQVRSRADLDLGHLAAVELTQLCRAVHGGAHRGFDVHETNAAADMSERLDMLPDEHADANAREEERVQAVHDVLLHALQAQRVAAEVRALDLLQATADERYEVRGAFLGAAQHGRELEILLHGGGRSGVVQAVQVVRVDLDGRLHRSRLTNANRQIRELDHGTIRRSTMSQSLTRTFKRISNQTHREKRSWSSLCRNAADTSLSRGPPSAKTFICCSDSGVGSVAPISRILCMGSRVLALSV